MIADGGVPMSLMLETPEPTRLIAETAQPESTESAVPVTVPSKWNVPILFAFFALLIWGIKVARKKK